MTARAAGVMLPLSSLPSGHGIGDMGAQGEAFIDMLRDSGARYWQILPVNPLGYGNSPYQPYSSFAGDPIFISLDRLYEQGLLRTRPAPFCPRAVSVDYDGVRAYKDRLLRKAFEAFTPQADYDAFIRRPWVRSYAVFMTFKRANGMRAWNEWPPEQKDWPMRQEMDLAPFEADIRYEMFLQYVFFTQWMALKAYANGKGVEIIGDIPIYVGLDSQDVWMGRENFLLDENGQPIFVAGVPPDYFSETGQRWGNPVYNWAHIERDGFAFWIERLRHCAELFDVVRIDHFRGFDTYWEIPASCPTAIEGEWREAPGYALFDTVTQKLPGLRIIAEDLGMMREEVYQLRDHYHLPGMKIIQFTFEPGKEVAPASGRARMVVYTGTHDNQTVAGWYRSHAREWRREARRSLAQAGYRGGRVGWRFVRLAMDDAAELAIIPAQDILCMGDAARMNTPGTVGSPNWEWKLTDLKRLRRRLRAFAGLIVRSGRRGGA